MPKQLFQFGKGNPNWKGGVTKDKEYRRAYQRKWREKNKERDLIIGRIARRKYRKNHPENKRVSDRVYRKRWRVKYPDKNSFQNARWRARKNGASGSHTLEEWNELKRKFNYICPHCGKSEPEIELTQDHIIPLTRGGSDNIINIQPLCRSGNASKGNRMIKVATV